MAALDVAELVVREADGTDETFLGKLGHRTPHLFERHARFIGPVQEMDVDVVAL
jgi:hypothetical protein